MIEGPTSSQMVYADRPSQELTMNSGLVRSNRGLDIQRIHMLLRGRYHWAILLSLVLGTGGAIGGFRLGKKTYQSGGVIRVMPVVPKILYTVDEKGEIPAFDTYVDAQVAVIRSQRVIDKALDDKSWGALGAEKSDQALSKFINSLDVSRQGDMILVRAIDVDPQVAMTSVNTIISAYTKVYDEIEAESGDNRRQLREEWKTKLNNQYLGFQQQIKDLAKVSGSDDLKPQYDFKLSELNKLDSAIGELQRSLPEVIKANVDAATTQPTSNLSVDQLAAIDPRMTQLLDYENSCKLQVERLNNQNLLSANPKLIDAKEEVALAQREVEQYLEKYNLTRSTTGVRLSPITGLSEAEIRYRIKTMQDTYAQSKQDLIELGREKLEFEDLRSQSEDVKSQLDETRHVIDQLELESRVTGRISVVSMADRPLGPFRDTRPTFAGAGGFGGILGGFGSILLIGLVGRRLDRPEDAQASIIGVPLLGVLAKLPDDLADPEQAAIASHSVHQIRTLLQIMGQGARHQVFGITSPAAGTGKTSLTLALGISFAASQLKTLLIDCDLVGGGLTDRVNAIAHQMIGQLLRQQRLITEEQLGEALQIAQKSNRRLGEVLIDLNYLTESQLSAAIAHQGQSGEPVGVLDALNGEELGRCITPTGIERLSILPLGGASPQHAGSLSPNAFNLLIEAARKQFDVVLVDTGPVPGSLEASVVASQVDAVVLTVSRGEQSEFVDASVSHLVSVGARIAGLVFNRARTVDVLRHGSSGLGSTNTGSSVTRVVSEPSKLPPDSDRFGPIARAVAFYVPAPKSNSKTS
ncbi:MAG: hypothetical protein M3O30_09860 [Planctomycetota bacterium]|nr:hypothetical protein [Planctomycetota bacterium]